MNKLSFVGTERHHSGPGSSRRIDSGSKSTQPSKPRSRISRESNIHESKCAALGDGFVGDSRRGCHRGSRLVGDPESECTGIPEVCQPRWTLRDRRLPFSNDILLTGREFGCAGLLPTSRQENRRSPARAIGRNGPTSPLGRMVAHQCGRSTFGRMGIAALIRFSRLSPLSGNHSSRPQLGDAGLELLHDLGLTFRGFDLPAVGLAHVETVDGGTLLRADLGQRHVQIEFVQRLRDEI
jgi:hypothetical protein